jgi:hypothetical protein
MKRFCWALVLIGTFAATARGAEVTITGAGVWGEGTQVTPYSAQGATWSFTVTVPSPLDLNPTSMISNAEYDLNGVPVGTAMISVAFFTSDQGGGFDLNFADNNTVSLSGPTVIDGNSNVLDGTYSMQIAMNDGPSTGMGAVVIGAAVPEPSTLVSLSVGLFSVAAAGIRARRRLAA